MKTPHIVYIIHSFSTGGIEKVIASLISHTRKDYTHTIICLTRSGRFEDLLPEEVKVISMEKPPGNSFFFFFRLARLLKDLNPDIVHTLNWAGLDGVIAARMAGIKNIVHAEHGWGMDDPYGQNRKRIWIRRILSLLVREYICVSRQIQSWLIDKIKITKPVTLIYNGVDTEQYSPGPDRNDPSFFHIGIVGRLDPIKDHATLIRAFQAIEDKLPEAQLSIIGDGPEKTRLETMACDDSRICFLGDRSDVPELLKALDVFVLSSLNEGISNTVLEAMATSIPPVVTNAGGNPEIVTENENGRLFASGDWKTLAQYLQDYYHHPEQRKIHGKMARKTVIKKFSMNAMISGYTKVWKRITDSTL